jgi:hypothetical protein
MTDGQLCQVLVCTGIACRIGESLLHAGQLRC